MKKALSVFMGLNLILFLFFPPGVYAGSALETIQLQVNKVFDVLENPALKAESAKKIKKGKLEAIVENMFDFKILSQRALAKNWKKLNAEQQMEFISLYKALLEKTYMDRILAYTDEKVVFDKEIKLSDNKAEVQSNIVSQSGNIPIYYRMFLRQELWKVYDVIIEGVSLTKNYRTQFKEILLKKSSDELLNILHKKINNSK